MKLCGSCEAPIFFVLSATGKPMPLDVHPNNAGNVQIVNGNGIVMSGAALERARAGTTELYMPHFATCPKAKEWRKRS